LTSNKYRGPLELSGTTLRRADVLLDFKLRCRVDRQAIRDELVWTERQLAEVEARIEKQKAVLNRLEAAGENTAHASFLLEQSLGWQKLNETHRERLKRELARA